MGDEIRHAYVILTHRAPDQLRRLVSRLDARGVSFLLHVDRRSPPEIHRAVGHLASRDNVEVLPSQRTPWPGPGHMDATVRALRALRDLDPDYVSLLTGQDYPLKNPAGIDARLRAAQGASFLQHFPLPRRPGGMHLGVADELGWPDGGCDRIRTWNFEVRGAELRVPGGWAPLPLRRRLPRDVRFYGGSGYWTLSRTALAALHRVMEQRPGILRFYKRVYLPHESFFHTVLAGAPDAGPLVNDDLRYIDWGQGGAHPKFLGLDDVPALASSDALFARKFDDERDPQVLDRVDQQLLGG